MNALALRQYMFQKPVLAVVLAGGRGSRLGPLTESRCKPDVPFGKNRFIDFALANIVNSQIINHAMILTQYRQQGLIAHLNTFDLTSHTWGKTINIVPAQQQLGDDSWYEGTANAVHQNKEMVKDDPADIVVILAADHICKIDIRQMLAFHLEAGAEFTVCGMTMPLEEAAGNFGVMELDDMSRIIGFAEKPEHPKPLPGDPNKCFASIGMYITNKAFLLRYLEEDHHDTTSLHDFGQNIIPKIIASGEPIFGYDYNSNFIPGEVRLEGDVEVPVRYWRDVGRIGPYWEAVMDLTEVVPLINIYNDFWPIPTGWDRMQMAKFVTPDIHVSPKTRNVLLAGSCIIDNHKRLDHVVLSRSVRIGQGANLERTIVFDRASVGAGTVIRNTIVEEGVVVPPNVRIGFDLEEDVAQGVVVDPYHLPSVGYEPIRVVTRNSFKL